MPIDPNSEAALKTIDIQQTLIARLAAASATSKNWCVTVVSAVAIVAVDKDKWQFALVAVIPTLLFAAIDIYYLSLERAARNAHESFANQLRAGTAAAEQLFDVGTTHVSISDAFAAAVSKSVWLFYLLIGLSLIAVVFIAR